MDVYGCTPINKTAASVTSQTGCAIDDTLSTEQLRENLVAKARNIEIEILKLPKGSVDRKKLGVEKADIQYQINKIRPKRSVKGLESVILDVLREELNEFDFRRIIHKASERFNELKK